MLSPVRIVDRVVDLATKFDWCTALEKHAFVDGKLVFEPARGAALTDLLALDANDEESTVNAMARIVYSMFGANYDTASQTRLAPLFSNAGSLQNSELVPSLCFVLFDFLFDVRCVQPV